MGEFPQVALLQDFAETHSCTATLIGCNTVLTAATCFPTSNPDPDDYFLFFPHAGLRNIESITFDPLFTGGGLHPHDLAVLKLLLPVHGIRPMAINTVGRPAQGNPLVTQRDRHIIRPTRERKPDIL